MKSESLDFEYWMRFTLPKQLNLSESKKAAMKSVLSIELQIWQFGLLVELSVAAMDTGMVDVAFLDSVVLVGELLLDTSGTGNWLLLDVSAVACIFGREGLLG